MVKIIKLSSRYNKKHEDRKVSKLNGDNQSVTVTPFSIFILQVERDRSEDIPKEIHRAHYV